MAKIEAKRKITVKEILGGKIAKESDGRVKDQNVMLVYGKVRDHHIGNTQYGDFVEFIGQFEAKPLVGKAVGSVFTSTRLIVPPPAVDVLSNHYFTAKAEDETAIVSFAFLIGVEHSDRGSEGYRFTCQPIQDPSADLTDPLAELRLMLGEQEPDLMALGEPPAQLALAEPQPDSETETVGETSSKSKGKP